MHAYRRHATLPVLCGNFHLAIQQNRAKPSPILTLALLAKLPLNVTRFVAVTDLETRTP